MNVDFRKTDKSEEPVFVIEFDDEAEYDDFCDAMFMLSVDLTDAAEEDEEYEEIKEIVAGFVNKIMQRSEEENISDDESDDESDNFRIVSYLHPNELCGYIVKSLFLLLSQNDGHYYMESRIYSLEQQLGNLINYNEEQKRYINTLHEHINLQEKHIKTLEANNDELKKTIDSYKLLTDKQDAYICSLEKRINTIEILCRMAYRGDGMFGAYDITD